MKTPRYWVTLIYRLFLTYDEVTNEHKDIIDTGPIRANVSGLEVDESKDTREATKRRVPHRRAGNAKRV